MTNQKKDYKIDLSHTLDVNNFKIKTPHLWKRFRTFRRNHNSNLNMFLVCVAVILVWKGLRDLVDIYILPDNKTRGAIICIVLGILFLLVDDGKIDEL